MKQLIKNLLKQVKFRQMQVNSFSDKVSAKINIGKRTNIQNLTHIDMLLLHRKIRIYWEKLQHNKS